MSTVISAKLKFNLLLAAAVYLESLLPTVAVYFSSTLWQTVAYCRSDMSKVRPCGQSQHEVRFYTARSFHVSIFFSLPPALSTGLTNQAGSKGNSSLYLMVAAPLCDLAGLCCDPLSPIPANFCHGDCRWKEKSWCEERRLQERWE